MASRKTYFGIGLPKDPTDPTEPPTLEPADKSSPTVVDDDKVAESLKQLRSWYQNEGSEDDTKRVVVQPAPAANSVNPQPRPTAVGHATGDAPMHTPRPVAPDPMRATMFGHDVHRFDLDLPQSSAEPPIVLPDPQPASGGSGASFVDPPTTPRRQESRARAPEPSPVPQPADRAAPDASRLAEYLRNQAAQRLPQATWVSNLDDTGVHGKGSNPLAARIVFGIGVAALAVAIVLWFLSQNNAGTGIAPAPAPAAPAAIGIDRPAPSQAASAPRTVEGRTRDVAPERNADALDVNSKAASRRPTVLPQGSVSPTRTARRPAPAKPRVQERTEDDSASAASDSQPREEAPVAGANPAEGVTGAGDTERAPTPPPATEPVRPAKREPKTTRAKTGLSGDTDATLPPSTTD